MTTPTPIVPCGLLDGKSTSHNEIDQLRLANHYLKVALDQTADGVMLLDSGPLDASGPRVLYCNLPMFSLLGVSPDKGIRGLRLIDFAASGKDAEAVLGALRQAAGSGAGLATASLRTYYEGGQQDCVWSFAGVQDSAKHLLSFTVTVKAAVKESEPAPVIESDKSEERLRVENLAAMAQGIAHDVNNLLGPVLSQLSLLMPSVDPHSEVGEALEMMIASVNRAKQFTGQVVKAVKSRPHEKCATDLTTLVQDTVRLAQSGRNVKVNVRLQDGLPPALCDAVKISQVMQNLVNNGMEAMPKGGHMDVEVRVMDIRYGRDVELKPGKYIEVRVRDRGMGITPDNMARLFRESFTTKEEGSGIGLTTCKLIVEDHGGVIRVDTALGVGTEFRFYLPVAEEGMQKLPAPASKPLSRSLTRGSGTVLVVDDDQAIRLIASSILKRCGYRVLECDSGECALKTFTHFARSSTPVDVILMDLTLVGGMEGLETAKQIWELDPSAKIIISSGSVTDDVQRSFWDQGFISVLPKPYEAGELSDAVLNAIATDWPPIAAHIAA
jgi:signal transduction histidine kinase/CheY-like chemotaxis protein